MLFFCLTVLKVDDDIIKIKKSLSPSHFFKKIPEKDIPLSDQELIQIGKLYYVLYESNQKHLAAVVGYNKTATYDSLDIPDQVTYENHNYTVTLINSNAFERFPFQCLLKLPNKLATIGTKAFYSAKIKGQLTIPSTVIKIKDSAFKGCMGLSRKAIISKSIDYGNEVFSQCGFSSVEIENGVETIPFAIFYNNSYLVSQIIIPESVLVIEELAFTYSPITELVLQEGLNIIKYGAFAECTFLEGNLTFPRSIAEIEDRAFGSCIKLRGKITILEFVKYGQFVFSDCGFSEVEIEEGVDTISYGNFWNNSYLKSQLKIPESVEIIEDVAFAYSSITGLVLHNGLRIIGSNAFRDCPFLEGQLVLPRSLEIIEDRAFRCCSGLKGKLYLNVKSIGHYAFMGCTGLTSLEFGQELVSFGNNCFFGCEGLKGSLTFGLDAQQILIGNSAFSCCYGLDKILTLSSSILYIGTGAFSNCNFEQIVFLTLNGVTTEMNIDSYAFSYCSKLVEVTAFPPNLNAIHNGLFYSCRSLSLSILFFSDNCTKIGNLAFFGCISMRGVLNLTNIETIGSNAFYGCKFTGSLVLPPTLKTIEENAFSGCLFSESISIPKNIISIGSGAFSLCVGFTGNIEIYSDIEIIQPYTFNGCENLKGHLILPPNIKIIGKYAFSGNNQLTGILHLPESLIEIGDYAFCSCQSFHGQLTLPNTLERIGERAFSGCTGFKEKLTIPEKVNYIGEQAFYRCSNFDEVQFENSKDINVDEQAFGNLEIECFQNLPQNCTATENGSRCYSSNGFGKTKGILHGKINENCHLYKFINLIIYVMIGGIGLGLLALIGKSIVHIIKNWKTSKRRMVAILKEIIQDNLPEWQKDKNNEEIIIQIGNEIHDRLRYRENEVIKKHFTKRKAASILKSVIENIWPTIPLDDQATIIKMSLADIEFKPDSKCLKCFSKLSKCFKCQKSQESSLLSSEQTDSSINMALI